MQMEVIVAAVLLLVLLAAWLYAKTPSFQWKTYSFKEGQFSIESPYRFKTAGTPNESLILIPPPKIASLITVVFAKYRGAEALDLEKMKESMIAIFANQGCYDFRTNAKETTCSGSPALLVKGAYKDPTEMEREMRMLVVKRDPRWWAVAINFAVGDAEQEKNAERMIQSFRIIS